MNPSEFVERWKKSGGAEMANSQLFLTELCDLLGVPHPDGTTIDTSVNNYVFEKAVQFNNGDGTLSNGRVERLVMPTVIEPLRRQWDAT